MADQNIYSNGVELKYKHLQLAPSLSLSDIPWVWNLSYFRTLISVTGTETMNSEAILILTTTWLKNLTLYLLFQTSCHRRFLGVTCINSSFFHTFAYAVLVIQNTLPLWSIWETSFHFNQTITFFIKMFFFNLKISVTYFFVV